MEAWSVSLQARHVRFGVGFEIYGKEISRGRYDRALFACAISSGPPATDVRSIARVRLHSKGRRRGPLHCGKAPFLSLLRRHNARAHERAPSHVPAQRTPHLPFPCYLFLLASSMFSCSFERPWGKTPVTAPLFSRKTTGFPGRHLAPLFGTPLPTSIGRCPGPSSAFSNPSPGPEEFLTFFLSPFFLGLNGTPFLHAGFSGYGSLVRESACSEGGEGYGLGRGTSMLLAGKGDRIRGWASALRDVMGEASGTRAPWPWPCTGREDGDGALDYLLTPGPQA